jgi:competence protein ComEA
MKSRKALVLTILSLSLTLLTVGKEAYSANSAGTTTAIVRETTTEASGAGTLAQQAGKVNVNAADEAALTALPGIGPKKARSIIEYREANGNFNTLEDLMKVKGIGPSIAEKIKDMVVY